MIPLSNVEIDRVHLLGVGERPGGVHEYVDATERGASVNEHSIDRRGVGEIADQRNRAAAERGDFIGDAGEAAPVAVTLVVGNTIRRALEIGDRNIVAIAPRVATPLLGRSTACRLRR